MDGTAIPILNNFRGRHLNGPNDLVFDSNSNIWFTDPPYGWCQGFLGVQPPELPNGIYFFNTKSKALIAVSNSVVTTPNGLAFSPDGSKLYVADSNSTSGKPLSHYAASLRNVWAFDARGSILSNPRMIYQAESGWPDGLQVTRNGYVLVAALGGVDVIDPTTGLLLGKINTPDDIVFNLERGPRRGDYGMWLLTGQNYIYKVMMRER
jgi:gluconolactonase